MISAVAWVPAGVASTRPRRYEMSAVENELLQQLQESSPEILLKAAASEPTQQKKSASSLQSSAVAPGEETKGIDMKISGPRNHGLPDDLRMDEYSDDEEDDGGDSIGLSQHHLGQLLLGETSGSGTYAADLMDAEPDDGVQDHDDPNDHDDEEEEEDDNDEDEPKGNGENKKSKKKKPIHERKENDDEHHHVDNEDDDIEDDEDDLEDIPDTREYMPIDVEGLQAMGLSQIGRDDDAGQHAGPDDEGAMMPDEINDEDSEADDVFIRPGDALILVAKTVEDFASLEVQLYDQITGNLFVHHDIPLPSFPLCLAHGQVSPDAQAGNFCAVGTFDPGIEVWNLDVLHALEPTCILGGEDTTWADDEMKRQLLQALHHPNSNGGAQGRKRGPGRGELKPESHTQAVMSLSWNHIHRQVIASGSADGTVKLWDITQANHRMSEGETKSCNAATFTHHKDKVQSVCWHPKESTLLATGSFDRTVALLDARTNGEHVKNVRIPADCEALVWDPFRPELLTVASEDGTLTCWDVRKFVTAKPIWTMVASEFGGVADLSYNALVPGLMATCSHDKSVTLWDAHSPNPRRCANKDMGVGKLYTVEFYPSTPWLLGCGGSGNQLALWDLSSEAALHQTFGDRSQDGADSARELGKANAQADLEAMMSERKPSNKKPAGLTEKRKNGQSKEKSGKSKPKAHRRGR